MLPGLMLLLLCQLVGEAIVRVLSLPVPGPVIGMAILFVGLSLWRRPATALETTADGLLRHLSLLFVPAGVGVTQYASLLSDEWLPVAASVVGGTLVTIVVTALVLRALAGEDVAEGAAR